VKLGQQTGRIGFAGDSIFPHLHYSLMDGREVFKAWGLPAYFSDFRRVLGSRSVKVCRDAVNSGVVRSNSNEVAESPEKYLIRSNPFISCKCPVDRWNRAIAGESFFGCEILGCGCRTSVCYSTGLRLPLCLNRYARSGPAIVGLIAIGLLLGGVSLAASWHTDPHWYGTALILVYAPAVWIGYRIERSRTVQAKTVSRLPSP
jgi:hypothetical protein